MYFSFFIKFIFYNLISTCLIFRFFFWLQKIDFLQSLESDCTILSFFVQFRETIFGRLEKSNFPFCTVIFVLKFHKAKLSGSPLEQKKTKNFLISNSNSNSNWKFSILSYQTSSLLNFLSKFSQSKRVFGSNKVKTLSVMNIF